MNPLANEKRPHAARTAGGTNTPMEVGMSAVSMPQPSTQYQPVTTGYTLPAGVKFYELTGFATTNDAYEALSADDGWVEESASDGDVRWKEMQVNGGRFTVYTPLGGF